MDMNEDQTSQSSAQDRMLHNKTGSKDSPVKEKKRE